MKNRTLQRQAPRLPGIHVEHLNSVTIVENEFDVHKIPCSDTSIATMNAPSNTDSGEEASEDDVGSHE